MKYTPSKCFDISTYVRTGTLSVVWNWIEHVECRIVIFSSREHDSVVCWKQQILLLQIPASIITYHKCYIDFMALLKLTYYWHRSRHFVIWINLHNNSGKLIDYIYRWNLSPEWGIPLLWSIRIHGWRRYANYALWTWYL